MNKPKLCKNDTKSFVGLLNTV